MFIAREGAVNEDAKASSGFIKSVLNADPDHGGMRRCGVDVYKTMK